MRILVITAYYPPCDYGYGYMRICEAVTDGLANAGHQIVVLTSTYRHGPEMHRSYPVYRQLNIDPDFNLEISPARQFFLGRRKRENKDIRAIDNLIGEFKPNIIFIWHANGLSRVMLQKAENNPNCITLYYFANYLPEYPDEYLRYWSTVQKGGLRLLGKKLISKIALSILAAEGKPVRLKYRHSISVSEYVRNRLLAQNLIGADAVVVHNGVDANLYKPDKASKFKLDGRQSIRFLIAGRIAPEKGIHTALLAIAQLMKNRLGNEFHLSIFGSGPVEYRNVLDKIVYDNGLEEVVHFYDPVPPEMMPETLNDHDILLFPSEWDEPLACIMLEAMSSGTLVLGTATGGSGEILDHNRTGLVFETGNPDSLAMRMEDVINEHQLFSNLTTRARMEIVNHFNISHAINQIEQHLSVLANTQN